MLRKCVREAALSFTLFHSLSLSDYLSLSLSYYLSFSLTISLSFLPSLSYSLSLNLSLSVIIITATIYKVWTGRKRVGQDGRTERDKTNKVDLMNARGWEWDGGGALTT